MNPLYFNDEGQPIGYMKQLVDEKQI